MQKLLWEYTDFHFIFLFYNGLLNRETSNTIKVKHIYKIFHKHEKVAFWYMAWTQLQSPESLPPTSHIRVIFAKCYFL